MCGERGVAKGQEMKSREKGEVKREGMKEKGMEKGKK